jgi:hypothetical protein
MKKSLVLLLMALAVFGLLIVGCKKSDQGPDTQSDPPGVTNETTAMQYAATNDGFVQNDITTFVDQAVENSNTSTFGKVDSAIIPVRWGRFVNPGGITRTVTVTVLPGDSIAIVNIQREVLGNFAILAKSNPTDTIFFLVQKPFHDHTNRNVIFKRISRAGLFMGRWLPVATSLVDGGTVAPDNNISITRIAVYYPSGDSLVVTNPDSTYLLYRWVRLFVPTRKDVPEFIPGDRVKLQVTVLSKDATGDFVALRYGVDGLHHKRALLDLLSDVNNGDGTYTRVYETSRNPAQYLFMHYHTGWFHLGIDAITKETMLQNPAPYSASWWGIPYRVF